MPDPIVPAAPAAPVTPVVATPAAPVTPTIPVTAATIEPAAPAAPDAPAVEPAAPATDWRDRYAAGDAQFRKRLDRFSDESAFVKSYRAMEQKMSSGEMKKSLPEGATAEEVATWRKEAGLPEKPEGYVEKLELPKGLVLGEADKPIVAEFAKAAFDGSVEPKQFNGMVAKYYEIMEAEQGKRQDQDNQQATEGDDLLRTEWGPDYRRNKIAANNLLASLPDAFHYEVNGKKVYGGALIAARMPDGKLVGNDPGFLQWLAQKSAEINPTATLLPAGTSDPAKGVSDRLNELKGMLGDRDSAYWKGPKANDFQNEYRELLEAQNKMKARAA